MKVGLQAENGPWKPMVMSILLNIETLKLLETLNSFYCEKADIAHTDIKSNLLLTIIYIFMRSNAPIYRP